MKLWALDTSGSEGAMAVLTDAGEVLYNEWVPTGRSSGGLLFATVQACVDRFGPADRIVVGLGPGSYSGIRQLIALAEGLRLGWGSELLGWPSAAGVSDEMEYQVVGDARREMFYYTKIYNGLAVDGPRLLTELELRESICRGTSYATEPLVAFPEVAIRRVDATLIARAALRHPEYRIAVAPFYLREPNITGAKNPPRLGVSALLL